MELNREELTEAFEFLDGLRLSGVTNMFGAVPFIQDELVWERKPASQALTAWMDTFDGESSVEDRVTKAIEKEAK